MPDQGARHELVKHLAAIAPATASCQFQPVEEIVDEDGFDGEILVVDAIARIAKASSFKVRLNEHGYPVTIRHLTEGLTDAPATLKTECNI